MLVLTDLIYLGRMRQPLKETAKVQVKNHLRTYQDLACLLPAGRADATYLDANETSQ